MLLKTKIAALVITTAAGASAYAHPQLKETTPADGSVAAAQVTEIRLVFSEGLIGKLSGVDIKDQAGKLIAVGAPAIDPKDKKQLVIPLQSPLGVGQYTVDWHAVSEDTHRIKGSYSFKVAP